MYENLSSVVLYKLPIPLTRMDNINWGLVDKEEFFSSIPQLEIKDWTDLYPSRDIVLPLNSEIARDSWDYIKYVYKNEVGVDKEYYYFIENFIYVSQEACMPVQVMDTWTTYSSLLDDDLKYYVNRLTCKAERYHKVEAQSAPKYDYKPLEYDDSVYYAVLLNKSKRNLEINGRFNIMYNGNKIDEIPFEGIYVFCNAEGLNYIKNYEYPEYVENIYSIVGEQIAFCKSQVDANNYVYYHNQDINLGKVISVELPTGYTDILLRYPYFYVDILGTPFDPIDFDNPRDIKFLEVAIPIGQGGISYLPINYRHEEVNRYSTTSIKLSSSIGGILNYENSIAYKQANEVNANTITAAGRQYSATTKKITTDTEYAIAQSEREYKETLFDNKVEDLQTIYDIPLGFASTGALVAGASFLGDIPLIGGALKSVGNTISGLASDLGNELQNIDGLSIRDILKRKNDREKQFLQAKQPLENEVANVTRLAAIESANISNKYLRRQPNYTVPVGDLFTLVDKKKPQVVTIDSDYIDNMRNYYDVTAHVVLEYRRFNIYRYNYGKYYDYVKAMLVDIPDIEVSILNALMDIINSGIRLWKTTDPDIFAHYELLNKEVE